MIDLKLKQALMLAFGSINSAKLRSTLTTLGIIIGVAAVVANLSLGASFNLYFEEELGDFGDNFIIVIGESRNLFSDQELETIRRTSGVESVAPMKQRTGQVTFRGVSRQINVEGIGQDYPDIVSVELESGNHFSDTGQYVAVVGYNVATERFDRPINTRNSIDITFRRNDGTVVTQTFRVLGVTKEPDPDAIPFNTQPPEDNIYIPIYTMNELLNEDDFGAFVANTATRDEVRAVSESIDRNIARSIGISARDLDNEQVKPYTIINQADIIEQLNQLSFALTVLITAVAFIALIVGSIGIMNIMLVTVTERTREIGLMKSIGFDYQDILNLFIIEAVIVSLIGGILGTLLGLIGSFALEIYLGLPHIFPIQLIFLGLSISIIIGLVSGVYPASKAAKMDPVEALRHE